MVGAYAAAVACVAQPALAIVYESSRCSPTGGLPLSGGQQQMCAIARALMAGPRLLLCDEVSLGLAPIVIRDIYQRLPTIKAEGTSVIIVEQDIVQALSRRRPRLLLPGRPPDADRPPGDLTRDAIHAAYFGL